MLEHYYKSGSITTDEKTQRLLAVQAALEIVKASVNAHYGDANNAKLKFDIQNATEGIGSLADAIQEALKG